jgi:hypothetical protein
MQRLAVLIPLCFLLSACVTEPEPINDGRILSGGSGKALERAYGLDPELYNEPFDAVFYISREFSSVIKYRCDVRAAFDAQGYVAYPERLTLNGIELPALTQAEVDRGAYNIVDTLAWGSDRKIKLDVRNFLHKDITDSFGIAQPFGIREGWSEDTVLLGNDLVVKYDNVAGDTASWWTLTSLTDDPNFNGGSPAAQFEDKGTVVIPASALAMLGENARFSLQLQRTKRSKIRTPSGLYIGVISHYTEYAWYYLKKP